MDLGHVAGLAFDGIGEDGRRDALRPCQLGRRFERKGSRGDGGDAVAGKGRIVGARGGIVLAGEERAGRGRQVEPIEPGILARLGAGAGERQSGAGGDQGRIVARHVRDHEGGDARRGAERRQASALDGGKLVADEVHHRDGRTRSQQRPVDGLFVVEAQPRRRGGQERGAAARDQRHHQIVRGEARDGLHHAARGVEPGLVGHGMGRLDDFDALAGLGIAIARHHQPAQRTVPGQLERPRHLGRGLARPDHHRTAGGTLGQMAPNGQRRLGLRHGMTKHLFEQRAIHRLSRLAIRCWRG